ncbi:hypothetical protein FB45DRAFT_1138512 [Roridomyces roridus]|uniref:Uncharacterized protein n=1 Tax=Roridomyces roridus TaxID=1738132 RepID=A0AAD7C1M7_9AGAR|nr:hypothetical protein FB45DRAFT_1138512 [Roridomyces roridus]
MLICLGDMIFSGLLFSPTLRVWNLRLLLLATLVAFIWLPLAIKEVDVVFYILSPTFVLILVHHVAFLFRWPIPILALVDWLLAFLESCGVVAGLYISALPRLYIATFKFVCIPLGTSMLLSMIFRTATILQNQERLFHQRFAFLGGCPIPSRPYTPLSILPNRSISRPLVRGESTIVILVRAVVLSRITIGLPIFAVYFVLVSGK